MPIEIQPSGEQIRAQLERILQSQDFSASSSISTFLRYVVEETLAGRGETIKGYTIAVRAYGRDASFDPQTDTLVRTHARRLRRALERYYLTTGADDPLRITIQSGSYLPTFTRVSTNAPVVQPAISACETHPGTIGSIWVFPFVAADQDEQAQWLAADLSEAVYVSLSAYSNFATHGPCQFGDEDKATMPPATSKKPCYTLGGTVSTRFGVIRITVRLSQHPGARILWAHRFELAGAQDESEFGRDVAARTAAMVADNFGVVARTSVAAMLGHGADDPDSVDPTLAYLHAAAVLTKQSLQRATTALQSAVRADPNSASANAMLADLMLNLYLFQGADEGRLAAAERLIRRALALDPNCALLDTVQAQACRLRGCQAFPYLAEQAVRRHPHNPTVLGSMGALMALNGQWERGLELLTAAERLNAHLPGWYGYASFLHHYRRGDYAEALKTALAFKTPRLFWDPLLRAAAYGQLGLAAGAKHAYAQLARQRRQTDTDLRALMLRLIPSDEDVAHVLEGLDKAKTLAHPARDLVWPRRRAIAELALIPALAQRELNEHPF